MLDKIIEKILALPKFSFQQDKHKILYVELDDILRVLEELNNADDKENT